MFSFITANLAEGSGRQSPKEKIHLADAFLRRDSAKQASLMALAAPSVH